MLTQIVIWLNLIANSVGRLVLAPVAWLPGWLSATLIAALTGVAMLLVFKHTSNQSAIKRARDQIKANMLALSLFKDELRVSLRCQLRLFGGAMKLLTYSLVPMAVMTIPMILILGQMALWYQARPLAEGEESIVTVQLHPDSRGAIDTLELTPDESVQVIAGPVRVPSKNMVCWNVIAKQSGQYDLVFRTGNETFAKELVVGSGFMPTSLKRPATQWTDSLIHPREAPFALDSIVQSIEVTYPERDSLTSGTNNWVIYWFVVSMIAAFAVKPFLNVNI